ncbi:uncharacterized protein [Lolium perenne]|uniref:uncharacterized protein n=1 Tax=Lolium perenne TaxID=4522 RepID=UPI003A9945B7
MARSFALENKRENNILPRRRRRRRPRRSSARRTPPPTESSIPSLQSAARANLLRLPCIPPLLPRSSSYAAGPLQLRRPSVEKDEDLRTVAAGPEAPNDLLQTARTRRPPPRPPATGHIRDLLLLKAGDAPNLLHPSSSGQACLVEKKCGPVAARRTPPPWPLRRSLSSCTPQSPPVSSSLVITTSSSRSTEMRWILTMKNNRKMKRKRKSFQVSRKWVCCLLPQG